MDADLQAYLDSLDNKRRREDAFVLVDLIAEASGYPPYLHGKMVGFGRYHYRYDSGHEGEWFVAGFAPRKQNSVVYIMPGFSEYDGLLAKLGKYKTGKSCLYINKLDDVDLDILRQLVTASVKEMQQRYECWTPE